MNTIKINQQVAIYARVSTQDKGQDVENQLFQLRAYCERQGWRVVEEYVDHMTGKHAKRDAFQQLFVDASRRKFDIVVTWALDRFTREGILETFEHIRKLRLYGVEFESYTESHFRTSGPAGELMLAMAAWIAKQERQRISERTKAGLDRARRAGKTLGPPRRIIRLELVNRAIDLRAQGVSWRSIVRDVGIPLTTLRERLLHVRQSSESAKLSA